MFRKKNSLEDLMKLFDLTGIFGIYVNPVIRVVWPGGKEKPDGWGMKGWFQRMRAYLFIHGNSPLEEKPDAVNEQLWWEWRGGVKWLLMITIQLNASVTVRVSLFQREEIQTTRTTDRVSHHCRFMKIEAEEHYEPVSKSEKKLEDDSCWQQRECL